MRICPKCRTTKPDEDFNRIKTGTRAGKFNGYCKVCSRKYCSEYGKRRTINDKAFAERERKRANDNRQNNKSVRIAQMFHSILRGSIKRGIPVSFVKEQIAVMLEIQQWKCKQTGIPFDLTTGKGKRPFGPTIDRIDNSKGYEASNIQIVCNVYNYAKNEFSGEDVIIFAKALLSHQKQGN